MLEQTDKEIDIQTRWLHIPTWRHSSVYRRSTGPYVLTCEHPGASLIAVKSISFADHSKNRHNAQHGILCLASDVLHYFHW